MNIFSPLWGGILLLTALAAVTLLRRRVSKRFNRSRTGNTPQDLPPESMVQNQNFDLSNFPPCPQCGSAEVAKMIYGKPALNRQIIAGLESGQIISGGCMIHGGAPEWHCLNCNKDFGHLKFDPSTGVDQ